MTTMRVGLFAAIVTTLLMGWLVPSAGAVDTNVQAQLSASSLDFPDTYYGQTSAPMTVTITSVGTDDLSLSGTQIETPNDGSFAVVGGTCTSTTVLSTGESCTVEVAVTPQEIGDISATLQIYDNTPAGPDVVALSVHSTDPTQGLYYPVQPTRILDTRSGLGAAKHPVAKGTAIALQVLGKGGVPTSGVSAVVLNLTVTHPTANGYVSAYPAGTTRPTVSGINYSSGWTGANLVTVPVGSNGAVDLYSSASVDVIGDIQGWYASSQDVDIATYGDGSAFLPGDTPLRILDTRSDNGVHAPLTARTGEEVAVDFPSDVNPYDVHAVDISLTGTEVHANGFLTATGVNNNPTVTSTLNLHVGTTTSNMAIVPVSPCSEAWCQDPDGSVVVFGIYNGSSGDVDVIADLSGAYVYDGYSPLRFHPVKPTRIMDTRSHLDAGPLGPQATQVVHVPTTVADDATVALAANVTAVDPTSSTYLTVWPTGDRPTASIMDPKAKTVVAVGSTIGMTDDYWFEMYNNAGTTNVLVDVSGDFDIYPATSPAPQVVSGAHTDSARSLPRSSRSFQPIGGHAAPWPGV